MEKIQNIETPKAPPTELYSNQTTINNGVFDFPIKLLKEGLAQLQEPNLKNMLANDIDFFCVKLGLRPNPMNMKEFQARELAVRQKEMTDGKMTSAQMTERYNQLVDYFNNLDDNAASIQMAIDNLIKSNQSV